MLSQGAQKTQGGNDVDFMPRAADIYRMLQLFEALLIAFIALVAFELFLIHRDLTRLLIRTPMKPDESAVKGQTINVNVGAPLSTEVRPTDTKPQLAIGATEHAETEEPEESEPDEETLKAMDEGRAADLREDIPVEPVEREPFVLGLRATESGLVAKKCPKCGLENSTYRSECFSCGANL